MVPTETLTSMLDEPSSGSMATTSGASACSAWPFQLLGDENRNRCRLQGLHEELVGEKIKGLLHIAAGVLCTPFWQRLRRQGAQRNLRGDLAGGIGHGAHHIRDRCEARVGLNGRPQKGLESLGLRHCFEIQHPVHQSRVLPLFQWRNPHKK